MTIKAFCSYNVLAHEKRRFYSFSAPASDIFDRIALSIPDELVEGVLETGEPLLRLDGMSYTLTEVLENAGDAPVLRWFDGRSYKSIRLSEVPTDDR